jgi:HEPN domain-containing protein
MMLDSAGEFLQKADEDLYLVDRVIDDPNVAHWILGFHCQQAAEKSLKAVLVCKGIHFQKIHDLFRLLQVLKEAGVDLPTWSEVLDVLTPFAVEGRYSALLPEDFDPYDARSLAREVRDWAQAEIRGSAVRERELPEGQHAEE